MTDAINDPFATQNEVNYLAELVGEGKKFATVEDLAKGKFHADTMIETLKAEIVAKTAEAANGANMDKLLEAINKGKNDDDAGGHTPDQSTQNPPPQNIEEIVLSTLEKNEKERAVKANKQKVIEKMSEVWGADASKELQKTATALGVSLDYLNTVAQQSPSVFFTLTGLNTNRTPGSGTAVPTSTVNFNSSISKVRDAKFYRELKQTDPKLYKDSKTQVQMHRDALALGEGFFN